MPRSSFTTNGWPMAKGQPSSRIGACPGRCARYGWSVGRDALPAPSPTWRRGLQHALDEGRIHIFRQLAQLPFRDADDEAVGVGISFAGNCRRIALALDDNVISVSQNS